MKWEVVVLVGVGALVAASGCASDEEAKLRATQIGALSMEPVPRVPFDGRLRAECGLVAPTEAAASELVRLPYLQRTTSSSTRLMWTARSREASEVTVAAAGGAELQRRSSQVDDEAAPPGAFQHVVDFTDLEPSTTYCYTLSAPDGRTLFGPSGFRTAPPTGADELVTFVAFGDSGGGEAPQYQVFEQVKTVELDLLLVTGDVAYPSGRRSELERNYFDVYAPMISSVAAFPVIGNHDNLSSAAGPFREVFALPENGAPEGREYWFSFDWGPVHFVALDTERTGEAQAAWLRADLEASAQPWTIVYTHKGPYSSGEHGSNGAFRRYFGDILEEHRVPLVLSGHDHDYERTKQIGATTYVVTGGGGKSTRAVGRSSFTAFSEDVLHFVHVTVDGEYLDLHAIDATGQEFDYVRIRSPRA